MTVLDNQPDLLDWTNSRPSADVIDIIPYVAMRMWQRRQWPTPSEPCKRPINIQNKGAA